MKEYEGAVLFIDVLGVGQLTSGNSVEIFDADFRALNYSRKVPISNQTYCAVLLSIFRKNLLSLHKRKYLNISQLSDCASIWSKCPNLVLDAARDIMWKNLSAGVLCRGGLSYGQIVEPNRTNRAIGHFVCGDAVTRSAFLEKMGKGARIFVDTELPGLRGLKYCPDMFSNLKNAADYKIIDEFKWFTYCPKEFDLHTISDAVDAINAIVRIIALLRHSPRYRWNASTSDGRLQIGSTIERLSQEIAHLDAKHSLGLNHSHYWKCEHVTIIQDYPRSDKSVQGFIRAVKLRELA